MAKKKQASIEIPKEISKKRYLYLAALEGFTLVCIELLGAKIIHSFYGAALQVWTVVLSFTLLGVSLGYALGAKFSAKNQDKRISNLFIACALSVLFSLLVSNPLFYHFAENDSPSGLFICSFIILVPPLIFLGALSPFFIQKLNDSLQESGSTAGRVYAISTFGGILAAFLTGFFILEHFGIIYPMIFLSFIFICLALILDRKKMIVNLGLFLILVLVSSYLVKKRSVNESYFVTIQYQNEGIFGQLRVFDKPLVDRSFSARVLSINGISQTIILNSSEATNFWRYPHVVNAFASLKKGDPKTLLLGLGGGSIARELKHRVKNLDVVEIDPRIIALSTEYFYLSPKGINFIQDDARHYIHQCRKKYDLVVYDVLTGETQPNYVFTKEALKELDQVLNQDALVVVNFQGIIKGKDQSFASLYKTFKEHGFHIQFYSTTMKKSEDIVFVLSKSKLNVADIKLENLNKCCQESSEIAAFLKAPFTNYVPDLKGVSSLTDDKPLLELLNKQAIKDWRKDQQETYTKSNLKYGISQFK